MDDKAFLPSSILELQDTQSKKSLAQIYEDDYTASAAGEAGKDPRGGKLATEHEEIEKTWSDICYKLDALCNTHFTPKQVCRNLSSSYWYSTHPACRIAKGHHLDDHECCFYYPRKRTSHIRLYIHFAGAAGSFRIRRYCHQVVDGDDSDGEARFAYETQAFAEEARADAARCCGHFRWWKYENCNRSCRLREAPEERQGGKRGGSSKLG